MNGLPTARSSDVFRQMQTVSGISDRKYNVAVRWRIHRQDISQCANFTYDDPDQSAPDIQLPVGQHRPARLRTLMLPATLRYAADKPPIAGVLRDGGKNIEWPPSYLPKLAS